MKIHFSVTHSETTNDPAGWNSACYTADPVDIMEPLAEDPNPYREYSLANLRILLAIDAFVSAAGDARLRWVAVSYALDLTSIRGLPKAEACRQMGVTERRLECNIARFKATAGIDAAELSKYAFH